MKLCPTFRCLVRLAAALCSFLAAISSVPRAQEVQKKTADKSSEKTAPSAAAENPAQIELLETRIRFEADGASCKEVHTRVKINNELGARQFARLNFDYNRTFENIDIPLVRITHATGGTADILPSAISDQPNPAVVNAPAYQDVRVKSVRVLGLQPNDLLEYRVVTTVSHHPLAPEFWLDHSFDRTGVVSREIFDLDLPGTLNSTVTIPWNGTWNGPLPVIYLSVPYTSFERVGEGNSRRSLYHWEIDANRKLAAALDDGGIAAPDVMVSTFSSWLWLVDRLTPLFLHFSADDHKELEARLHAIAANAKTGDATLRAAYDFVSQKLATVDLPLGATGFRLRSTKDVLNSSYATPEEKCLLLFQFAGLAKIDAQIVFLGAVEVKKQFARPSVFEHPFVVVSEGKKQFALDPSLEIAPFGLIPSRFRGKQALSLTPYDGGDYRSENWMELPNSVPFAAFQRVNVVALLATDGTLKAKVGYVMRGDVELLLREAFHQSSQEKWKEVGQLLALSDGFRGQVSNVTASDPYATREPFTVEYEITMPKFVDWSKKPVRVPAILPLVGLPDPPAKAAPGSSSSPIDLGTPLDVEAHVSLHLPAGTIAVAPTGTSIERDYASFSSHYAAKAGSVTASRHLHFLLREIPAARAADYNAFLRAVQNDEAQEFTLERAEIISPKTNSAAPSKIAPPNPNPPKP